MGILENLRIFLTKKVPRTRFSSTVFMHDKRLGQLYKCPRLIKYRRHYGHRRVIDYEFA